MFSIGSQEWPGISKLIEECGEVVQVCGKLMGSRGKIDHWDGSNLRDRLHEELGDLLAAIDFVIGHGKLDAIGIFERSAHKTVLFNGWHSSDPEAPVLRIVMSQELALSILAGCWP